MAGVLHELPAMGTGAHRGKGALAVALALCAGCAEPQRDSLVVCSETEKRVPVALDNRLDLLFVVDTSASMALTQASLRENFARFANILENIEGGLPGVHIAVISADLGAGPFDVLGCKPGGDGGEFQSAASGVCTPPDGAFIEDRVFADYTRSRNYAGSLEDALVCISDLGAGGCGFSQPLEAMRRALDDSNPANAGFLRDGAFLMVVFITDGDDCSASDAAVFDPDNASLGPLTEFRCFEHGVVCNPDDPRALGTKAECTPRENSAFIAPVAEYVDFLRGLKQGDPSQVFVSVASAGSGPVVVELDGGDPALASTCETALATARPSVRLTHFAAQFPNRNAAASLCEQDLSSVLAPIADSLVSVLGSPCLDGDIDLDPDTEGLQLECQVTDIEFPGTDREQQTVISRCSEADPDHFPCWQIEQDGINCPQVSTQSAFEVRRGRVELVSNRIVEIRCSEGCVELPPP